MKHFKANYFVILLLLWIQNLSQGQTSYNIYFGDNHSHSWYSDGNKDKTPASFPLPVAQSITWARNNRSSLDFMGISDHNHNESLNMTLAYWRSGVREADSVNQDGNFVGMFGQEWGTISGGGHVLIYGTNKLFGWNPGVYDVYVPKSNYALLWDSVKKYNGYCYLAHPNSSDFGNLASAYNAKADSVVRGVAMKSGNAFSTNTTETDPDAGDYTSYFNTLLSKGYHVAPIANQDNHNTTFGKSNQQRTAVVAPSLSKVNIDDAFRQRRVYATEDHNLQLRFSVDNHQMGEMFSMSGSVPFRIKVTDPDGESITKIELRYGVPGSGSLPTVLTSVLNKDSLIYSYTQTAGSTYYYYVYVQEADGNEAWSAPMWITISAGSPPAAYNLLSPVNAATNQLVNGSLTWQSSAGATSYDVYLGKTNPPAIKVSADQTTTTYNYSGLSNGTIYYWKVTAKNSNGSVDAISSPWNFTTVMASPVAFNMQSPANGATNQPIAGSLFWQSSTNATGYDVYLGISNPPVNKVSSNQIATNYAYSGLMNNTLYYWKIVARNSLDTIVATGAPWNFTTIISVPSAFQIVSPVDSSINQSVNGILTWQASTYASTYDVYLGSTNPPTTKVSADQTVTSFNYSNLLNNATYYWKVTAKNVAGSTDVTSSPKVFKTIVALPGSFNHLAPLNSTVNQSVNGTLTWQASANAVGYDVYLDTINPPIIKVSSDQTGTSYNFTNLFNGKSYYWKIVANNIAGSTIATSSPWNFTTIVALPGSFNLLTPVDLSTAQPLSGVLTWENSIDAASYDIYFDTISPPEVKIDSNLNTTSYNYLSLNGGNKYYWNIVAKNISGERWAVINAHSFTTIAVPVAPADVQQSAVSDSEIILTWTDKSNNEIGYRIYRSIDTLGMFQKIGSDLPANSTNFNDTGLLPNLRYYYKVVPYNLLGEGGDAFISGITLAKIPTAPNVFNVSFSEIKIIIDSLLNPLNQEYAIKIEIEGQTNYLEIDGSLKADIHWHGILDWGGNSGLLVSNLPACASYSVSLKARNLENIETIWSDPFTGNVNCYSVDRQLNEGWNLISIPVLTNYANPLEMFPNALSSIFTYSSGYISCDTIVKGLGYWIKIPNNSIKSFVGLPVEDDTISVQAGWNLIGTIAENIPVNCIQTEPANIIASGFYDYAGSYSRVDTLKAAHGYWLKLNSPGKMIFSKNNITAIAAPKINRIDNFTQSTFQFEDNRSNKQILEIYSESDFDNKIDLAVLPPLPPDGGFDVRFSTNKSIELAGEEEETRFPVLLQASHYPVKISLLRQITGRRYYLLNGRTKLELNSDQNIIINSELKKFEIVIQKTSESNLPTEFSLSENYPNPFNPSTQISYQIPTQSFVKIVVYDQLGREITLLEEGIKNAGTYKLNWIPETSSGIYFCKLVAVRLDNPQNIFTKTNRMIYLK
ncbi:MAG: CehA/McbA family metallohydrolase [Ignavibacteriales bacterium]|nr:CehA/McbA family metallohydrolase [Ignavibacteriales bacterium]